MCKKMIFLMTVALVLGLVVSAQATDIQDPMETTDISPDSIYSSPATSAEIWSASRSIDRDLTTNFGWTLGVDDPLTIVYDMGEALTWTQLTWWNRATSGDLAPDNIDVYRFTNDDPTQSAILVDMDLYTDSRQSVEGNRDNDDVIRDDIALTEFSGRYIKLVFDDGQQGGGGNIQM